MLYLIGLGLGEKDISLKAVEAAKKCDSLYYETFTSIWNGNIKNIEKIAGKKITLLKREVVESAFLVKEAKKEDVALLVPGDPLIATTHFELILEAKKHKISIDVIHSSSIYTAIAETGLQLYKFGRTTTLPKPQERFAPQSPLDIIRENKKSGLHSLVLLDIGMTAKEGLEILGKEFKNEKILAACNLGFSDKTIRYGVISSLLKEKSLDTSPAILIFPGNLHFKEEEALKLWE